MRGGKRKGAGRKKGFAAQSAEEARGFLTEQIGSEIEPLAAALIASAKKGNIQAIKELFDRAWGKSQQSVLVNDDVVLKLDI